MLDHTKALTPSHATANRYEGSYAYSKDAAFLRQFVVIDADTAMQSTECIVATILAKLTHQLNTP